MAQLLLAKLAEKVTKTHFECRATNGFLITGLDEGARPMYENYSLTDNKIGFELFALLHMEKIPVQIGNSCTSS